MWAPSVPLFLIISGQALPPIAPPSTHAHTHAHTRTRTRGFSLALSLLQDVDECSPPAEPCGPGHMCVNSLGSFRCECKAGYYFDGISRTCVGTWPSAQGAGRVMPRRDLPGVLCSDRGLLLTSANAKGRQSQRKDPSRETPPYSSWPVLRLFGSPHPHPHPRA